MKRLWFFKTDKLYKLEKQRKHYKSRYLNSVKYSFHISLTNSVIINTEKIEEIIFSVTLCKILLKKYDLRLQIKFSHVLHGMMQSFSVKRNKWICYIHSSSNFSLFAQTFQRDFIIFGRNHYAGPWICHLILKYPLFLLRMVLWTWVAFKGYFWIHSSKIKAAMI